MDYFKLTLQAGGLVGNALSAKLMKRPKIWQLPTSRAIFTLAFTDICVLISTMYKIKFIPRFSLSTPFGYAFQIAVCCTYIFGFLSSGFLMAYLAFERFVAIVLATKAKQINSLKNTRIAIAIVLSLGGLACFGVIRREINSDGTCTTKQNNKFALVGVMVILTVLPMLIVVILNIASGIYLMKKRKDASSLSVSLMCAGWFYALTIVVLMIKQAFLILDVDSNIDDANDIFNILNSSLNLIFYVLIGKSFRKEFLAMFRKPTDVGVAPNANGQGQVNAIQMN